MRSSSTGTGKSSTSGFNTFRRTPSFRSSMAKGGTTQGILESSTNIVELDDDEISANENYPGAGYLFEMLQKQVR